MSKRKLKLFITGIGLVISFAVWTVLVSTVDVQQIGPNGSFVGFATINGFFHSITGANMSLYIITDWLGLVPICIAFGFALLGLIQWIKRKSLFKVDQNILSLGCFYFVLFLAYIIFETVVINYRPVLIDGYLEASYPSSTTLLVMGVMPTSMMQIKDRIKNKIFKRILLFAILFFIGFMVIGRLISGVHWLTDIIGGILFDAGIVLIYYSVSTYK